MDRPRQVAGAAKPWDSPTPPCTQHTRRLPHAQRNMAGSFRSTVHPTTMLREREAPQWKLWPHKTPMLKEKHTDTHINKHTPAHTLLSGEKRWARPSQPSAVVFPGSKEFSCLGYKLRRVGILITMTEGLRDPGSPLRRRVVPTAAAAPKPPVSRCTTGQALHEALGVWW